MEEGVGRGSSTTCGRCVVSARWGAPHEGGGVGPAARVGCNRLYSPACFPGCQRPNGAAMPHPHFPVLRGSRPCPSASLPLSSMPSL